MVALRVRRTARRRAGRHRAGPSRLRPHRGAGGGRDGDRRRLPGRRLLAEVTSGEQARAAVAAGAHGLIARGHEAGGRGGELSTFVLVQQLLADEADGLPVWACGGIGAHTAAAAVAGGAAGWCWTPRPRCSPRPNSPPRSPARSADSTAPRPSSPTACACCGGALRRGRRRSPLEIGQDAFLPVTFQRRWGTLGAAIRGIRDAVTGALAADVPVLGPDSAASRAFGTRLPVAQGPMTG
ncbi:nitronate monooxygenase [Streptomyces sp. M19]